MCNALRASTVWQMYGGQAQKLQQSEGLPHNILQGFTDIERAGEIHYALKSKQLKVKKPEPCAAVVKQRFLRAARQ